MSMEFAIFQNAVANDRKNDGVFARFYDKAVKTDRFLKNGLPEFENRLFVEIRIRDQQDVFDQPATQEHIERFGAAYQKYLMQKEQIKEGTNLCLFSFLTPAQIECCNFRNIYTVEALAELDEQKALSLGLDEEKDLARRFLNMAHHNEDIYQARQKEQAYQAEIKALMEEISRLKKCVQIHEQV